MFRLRFLVSLLLLSVALGCSKQVQTNPTTKPTAKGPQVPGSSPANPRASWTDDLINDQIDFCDQNYVGSSNDPHKHCDCYVNAYANLYTPAQVSGATDANSEIYKKLESIFTSCAN